MDLEFREDVQEVSRRQAGLRFGSLPAFLVALGLSVFIHRAVLASGGTLLAGASPDSHQFIWFLGWFPHAIFAGTNPFVSHAIFAPYGANLAWSTSVPLVALLFYPLRLLAGPVGEYNLILTLLPALAAATMYLLAGTVARRFLPRLLAGLIYGFSPFMVQHEVHLQLSFAAVFVPVVVYSAIAHRPQGWLASPGVIALRAVSLWVLIGTGEEVFVFVAMAGLVYATWYVALGGWRALGQIFRRAVTWIIPGAAALLFSAPLFYFQLFGPLKPSRLPLHPANVYVSDLLNFVVPGPLSLVHAWGLLHISQKFTGGAIETTAYVSVLGLALLLAGTSKARSLPIRSTALAALTIALLSMGPRLHVAGVVTFVPLPWLVIQHLPGIGSLLPVRLSLILFLLLSLLVAEYADRRFYAGAIAIRTRAWVLIGLLVLLLAPTSRLSTSSSQVPSLFWDAAVLDKVVPPGSVVLTCPYPAVGIAEAMEFQAVANYSFEMVGGYATPHIRAVQDRMALGVRLNKIAFYGYLAKTSSTQLAKYRMGLISSGVTRILIPSHYATPIALGLVREVVGNQGRLVQGVWVFSFS